MTQTPPHRRIRADAGPYGYERALHRVGFDLVAGVDEAGRGACAGPLVAAAVVLRNPIRGLTDSKLLSPARRANMHDAIRNGAAAVTVASVDADECDRRGVQAANTAALRRAVARLPITASYVLSDGFAVDGLTSPGLGVWKGDRVAASISAASIVAKVTRDRIMDELDSRYPAYDFASHKGYVTPRHQDALARHGPCQCHRLSYANVRRQAQFPQTDRLHQTAQFRQEAP